MSIGVFMLHKNEALWVGPWLERLLPYVDQISLFDGNSDDGSLEIIEDLRRNHPHGSKIKLRKNADPTDLRDDYVRLFDECMKSLDTDLAWFLHPDQWVINPEQIVKIKDSDCVAMSCYVQSYAGEPNGQLYHIMGGGRCFAWKDIHRLRNPDLGAHYHGWYGAANEDIYYSEITGDTHDFYGSDFSAYPYTVEDSGIHLMHFGDVRPYSRRLNRMITSLVNQGLEREDAAEMARHHPRVTLESGNFQGHNFIFEKCEYPKEFKKSSEKWADFLTGREKRRLEMYRLGHTGGY